MNIRKYQTVSIWWSEDDKFRVRGYFRAASYLLSTHDDVAAAIDAAMAVPRRQHSIALVPLKQPMGDRP